MILQKETQTLPSVTVQEEKYSASNGLSFDMPPGFQVTQELQNERGSIRLANGSYKILIRVNPLSWEHFGDYTTTYEQLLVGKNTEEKLAIYKPLVASDFQEAEANIGFEANGDKYDIWFGPYQDGDLDMIKNFLASVHFKK